MRPYLNYLCVLFLILVAACKQTQVAPRLPLTLEEQQIALGNPSMATPDPSNENNYLMMKPQYALSYSRDRGIPNWVSWHVNKDWIGDAPRQNDFRADMTLPESWYSVTTASYAGSGFDRGHHVPSADRTKTAQDNSATFLMTNIIPQAPKNNQETWGNLEDYTRKLVEQGNEVYVIMGNYGVGGEGTYGAAQTIDQGRVTVPARIWKVLLILPEGENDINRVNTSTRVIAIDTPNKNTLSSEWGTFRTSVDAIEQNTGYDLLSNVPKDLQNIVEGRIDNGPTR
jgi:endonuclease G